ncbi:preprotein translocase subunit SecG [Arcticibacterium luteifluviistationis]|uniref:Protein-export membrane protein SecG n=1 Tax=Arcticibacterium luteifluviistationis TaxID=1784714 RepID=A0A2Z4GBW9_9BACT|nr:preprotein translocase subunit SecG [Arcticibacterium luteifluviistationis]AWV98696.1 preprotein translocase subunit SecG [Arcticibacterium luteifluviistationis]
MINTILILMVIAALLLIVVILVQNPKGGGLSSEFGGGATSQMFGVQKTGDILEKLTWGFFTFIIVGSLFTGLYLKNAQSSTGNSLLDVESSQAAPATAPSLPSTSPAPGLTAPIEVPAE